MSEETTPPAIDSTPAAPAAAPAAPPVTAPSTGAFYEGIQDADLQSWVKVKNWKDVSALAQSARHLEKMVGAPSDQVLRMPKEDAEWRDFYGRIGMPENPDGYEISPVDGLAMDESFSSWAKKAAHQSGFTKQQMAGFTKAYGEYLKERATTEEADYKLRVTADEKALQDEWRGGYDRKMEAATQAAKQLGFTKEMIDGMEQASGYAATMKFLAGLSERLGEDKFVASSGKQGFGLNLTPADAKEQWNQALMDDSFTKALMDRNHPGHKAALAKKSQLMALMHGTGAVTSQ
jgi:hypothetical protein